MYCPSCGTFYEQQPRFCKRCGANTTPASTTVELHMPKPRVAGMALTIALFSFAGLVASMLLLQDLSHRDLHKEELVIPFMASLIFVFGIAGLLVWQMSRMINTYQEAVRQSVQKAQNELVAAATPVLPPQQAQPAQLSVASEQTPSVVEHTTRSFHPPLYSGPGTRE